MDKIITYLFAARDASHRLHLKTRSFSAHIALGDFYDDLLDQIDTLVEIYQGKYGILDLHSGIQIEAPPEVDPLDFMQALAIWAENNKAGFNPNDTYLLSEWDNLISLIYRTKYKLENLA